MLKICEIFENLSYGVLQNLAIGEEGSGFILETRRPAVLFNINEALDDLHRRFLLSEQILTLRTYDHITSYKISPENTFSLSGSNYDPNNEDPDGPYIIDSIEEPFQDNMVKILSAYTSGGHELPINDVNSWDSIFTPHGSLIQVPNPGSMDFLVIEYQAHHPKLTYHGLESNEVLEQVVELPKVLHSAMYAYIAYKTYSNMNTQESSAKAAEHFNMYQGICQNVIEKDLVSEGRPTSNAKFRRGGWV